ncbi:hypothetical protein Tco_0163542 [Tanacetum coccineum]
MNPVSLVLVEQTFDRLQKLVSQLELLDEKLSQEDVNQKLLRSLPPEWNTHAVVWRNKADLDTMSMDDLYNNLKVEFRRISLTWFRNCASRSQTGASQSRQSTNCKNDDSRIIEEWVLDDEEEDVSQPKIEKKTNRPSFVKKEFVKSKQ